MILKEISNFSIVTLLDDNIPFVVITSGRSKHNGEACALIMDKIAYDANERVSKSNTRVELLKNLSLYSET